MPSDNHPKRGDTVYISICGELKKCTIIEVCKDSRSDSVCMVKIDEQYGDVLIVHLDELVSNLDEMREQRDRAQAIASKMWHNLVGNENEDCNEQAVVELSDKDEYELLYKAVGSIEGIVLRLINSATSDKPMSEAALLALRDKAEALGGQDVVRAIDTYFEELDLDLELGYDPDR